MWDGTVAFHFQLQDEGAKAFFAQANEHRILWSKILFWVDYRLFGASNHFLVASNVALMTGLWVALALAAHRLAAPNRRAAFLAAMICALPCFSWLQSENITWGYQSQFFLAYLLPLLALLAMAGWMRDGRSVWFYGSVGLGVASSVSMANGLLALPLLVLMLLANRRFEIGRLVGLIAITVATIGIWLIGYQTAPHPAVSLLTRLKFLVAFLGAPGHWIFQSDALAFALGLALLLFGLYLAIAWLWGKTDEPAYSALLLFLLHVVAAGAAAAYGRGFGGYPAALASRYETPVLLAYCSVLLMAMHLGRHRVQSCASLATLLGALTVILLPTQLQAFSSAARTETQGRMLAALALDLNVRDNQTTSVIYPADSPEHVERIHRIARRAVAEDLGVFARHDLRNAREVLGKPIGILNLEPCKGNLDSILPIATDDEHVKLTGWVFNPRTEEVPSMAFIISDGRIAGIGLTGVDRPDVREAVSSKARRAGFNGYALSSLTSDSRIYCATDAGPGM